MKVWVVMSNDYPDTVFAFEKAANEYCVIRKGAPDSKHPSGHPKIYWRAYEFEVRS